MNDGILSVLVIGRPDGILPLLQGMQEKKQYPIVLNRVPHDREKAMKEIAALQPASCRNR